MIKTETSPRTCWTSWWRPSRKSPPGWRAWLTSTSTRAATEGALRGEQCTSGAESKLVESFNDHDNDNVDWFGTRFAGGFGARDYRQTAAGGNAGGFGGRGGRNQGGHGGNRGFGGGEDVKANILDLFSALQTEDEWNVLTSSERPSWFLRCSF